MGQMSTWLDRSIGYLAPRWGLQRQRARVAGEMLARHFEAASTGRRTQGWKRSSGDANAALTGGLSSLRDHARDLVRNNGHATSAMRTIVNHVVGWGIIAKPRPASQRVAEAWKKWAETTACDADGRHDFYGLQKLAMRTVVESGEVLIRRRLRRPEDELPLPLQLQVLEPDYIDTLKTGLRLRNGGRIIHGIEFDPLGRRAAYWLFPEHPGAQIFGVGGTPASVRIPAESILHVFHQTRPGQVRGWSWYAPVILKMKNYDQYDDAQLMKQLISACLAVLTSDVDGTAPALGIADSTTNPAIDSLEPGMILNVPPGRSVTVVDPPRVNEFRDYSQVTLRAIATGLGVTYEDLTGDYAGMPFSAARMSRLSHYDDVQDWRWHTLIPQLCNPVWAWAMETAQIMGITKDPAPMAEWTAPPMPMIDPAQEGLAYQRNIRTGITTLSESIRERGYDPDQVFAEMAADNKKLDELGLVVDSDPRKTSQAGLTQARPEGTINPDPSEFDDATDPPPAPPAAPAAGSAAKDDDSEEVNASGRIAARLLKALSLELDPAVRRGRRLLAEERARDEARKRKQATKEKERPA